MTISEKFRPEVYSNESIIWRYMDFSKFVDILDSSCLFFSRLTVLRELDPYEGSFIPFGSHDKKDEQSKRIFKELDKILPNNAFVNCWYLSDIESAALWKLFPKSNEGIAIRSTIEKLNNAIESKSSKYTVYMGSVTYGHEKVRERKTDKPKSFSGDDAIFTKRACFEHEKELRLLVYVNDNTFPCQGNENGFKLEVDIDTLIYDVVVSPEAPSWIKDLTIRVANKYGFSFNVRQSDLNKLPF